MSRIPCPTCGETQTLEMMRWEVLRLKRLKEIKEHDPNSPMFTIGTTSGGSLTITGGTGGATGVVSIHTGTSASTSTITTTSATSYPVPPIPPPPELTDQPVRGEYRVDSPRSNGAETCVGCGRIYHPHVHEEAVDIVKQIEELRSEIWSPLELLAMEADD